MSEIKLPPLPYPQIPGNDYTASDMKDYAIAAIELDRQGRGEPSGYAYRYLDHDGGTVIRFNNGATVNGSSPIESLPFWFAPQPDEPNRRKLLEGLAEADGCFRAAYIEGLTEALSETTDARLKDLIERRILYAHYAIVEAISQPADPTIKESLTVAEPVRVPSDGVDDAKRLDWMARQDLDDLTFTIIRDAPNDGEYCINAGSGPVVGKTFRAAIDAAMQQERQL